MTPYLLCTGLLLIVPGDTNKADYPRPELLTQVSTLAKEVPAGTVRVLDVRSKAKYEAGHIPGAVWVDSATWSKHFGDRPDKEAWTKRLGALGLKVSDKVVVCGDDLREAAPRLVDPALLGRQEHQSARRRLARLGRGQQRRSAR